MVDQNTVMFVFHTMLNGAKAGSLQECASKTRYLPGEFWDCGCNAGGSAAIMKYVAPEKTVRMFDSFEGLPPSTSEDKEEGLGRFTAEFSEIMLILGPVHIGWVPEVFKGLENTRIALAHIDLDLYQGTKNALEFIAPRILPKGIIVVDDYGSDWHGVTRAVDEFQSPEFTIHKRASEQIVLERM